MVYELISGVVYLLEWKLFLPDGLTNLKTISKVKILILTDRNSSERLGKAIIWAQTSLITEKLHMS